MFQSTPFSDRYSFQVSRTTARTSLLSILKFLYALEDSVDSNSITQILRNLRYTQNTRAIDTMFSKIIEFALLASATYATAIPPVSFLGRRTAGDSAAAQLLAIAPTSNTCDGASFPSECATAEQAAPFLVSAMAKYGITSPSEIAAVLSVIAYETGDFKYNINHFPAPGRPGQGTRNMQMANYNLLYAQSIPALSSNLSAITTATSTSGLTDDQLNAIRALVLPDEYSWGSAAWYLTAQCASVRPALQNDGHAGATAYYQCIGTDMTEDRMAYWVRACTAFGISSST